MQSLTLSTYQCFPSLGVSDTLGRSSSDNVTLANKCLSPCPERALMTGGPSVPATVSSPIRRSKLWSSPATCRKAWGWGMVRCNPCPQRAGQGRQASLNTAKHRVLWGQQRASGTRGNLPGGNDTRIQAQRETN